MGPWLGAGRHPADCQASYEQCKEAVDEQGLPLIAVSQVAPDEWQNQNRGQTIEVMNRGRRPAALDIEGEAGKPLDHNEHLSNRESARDAAGERATAHVRQHAPDAECSHEEENGRGQPVVDERDLGQT